MPYFKPSDSSDRDVIPVADNGFATKHKQEVASRGRRRLVGSPVDSSECQVTAGMGLLIATENGWEIDWSLFEFPNHLHR